MSVEAYRLVIVGAGPAGLSAALWSRQLGVPAVVIDRNAALGGSLWSINNPITDYPGLRTANGAEFARALDRHLKTQNPDLRLNTIVRRISKPAEFVIELASNVIRSHALIAATGLRRRPADIEGLHSVPPERISYSATSDAHIGEDGPVAVLGGGDGAAENALILADRSPRVVLIHRGPSLRARRRFRRLTEENPRIDILLNARIKAIRSLADRIGLWISTAGDERVLIVSALVIKIGYQPNNELWRDWVACDEGGYLTVDSLNATSIPGLFAAGDIRNPVAPSIAAAVGQGAIAARAAFEYLRGLDFDL